MSTLRSGGPRWAVLTLALILFGVVAAPAGADTSDVVQRRAELLEVQRRIAELEKAVADTETTRSAAADKLAAAERAVSVANRRIRQAATERAVIEQDLTLREAEQRAVEKRIEQRQSELAGWLKRHYVHGGSDVAPFLSGRDPNQLARDARYLELLGKARVALIDSLRKDLREQSRLIESIAVHRDALVALEAEQRAQHEALKRVQAARASALAALARQLEGQQKEVRTLRQNEQQLAHLVTVLTRQAAEREAARLEATPQAPAYSVGRAKPALGGVRPRGGPPSPTGLSFAQLRGKMSFPVRGELVGRFGAQRAEGGTRWRGVFIRADSGNEVVAVAAGEVVFSDWLRGYGNLIIVDHGDDYLTIYGNNDALFKVVGERVGGGVAIASVGASGGAQESGLYFEIRHRGEPVDPLQWVLGN